MKVVHLTSELTGGAGLSALRLHAGLRTSGVDSELVHGSGVPGVPAARQFNPAGNLSRRYLDRFADQRIWAVKVPEAPLWSRSRRFVRGDMQTAVAGAEVVHLHWIAKWLDYRALFAAIPREVPVVMSLHDASFLTGGCHQNNDCEAYRAECRRCPQLRAGGIRDPAFRGFRERRKAYAGRRITAVPVSRWTAERARSAQLFRDVTVAEPIYPGLDTTAFQQLDRRACRSLLGIPESALVVASGCADLSDRNKGMGVLLESLERTAALLKKEVHLLTFGGGALLPETGGVRVHPFGYTGSPKVLAQFYSAADLCCVPSLMETFGLTAAEASACGTPVVAFRTGGLPDAVAHGETGILVDEVGDPAALAESITALLRDPAGREQMGRHGRSRALAQLDIGITVARFKELYERLLARPEGR
jgi:glycosyltransferase involved in cell wall biosynthesis